MRILTVIKEKAVLASLVFCMFLLSSALATAASDNIQNNKDIAKQSVSNAAAGLGGIAESVKDKNELIDLIRSFVEPICFYPDNSGYFYVYDYDCVNIAHPVQPALVGKNLYNYQDSKGGYVIRELARTAKQGGGFVEYYWAKPGEEGEYKKIGYVEPIPNTDYFIGTGVYLPEMAESK